MIRSSWWARALAAGATAWVALLFAAPAALARGPGLARASAPYVYVAASRICHQRPERSFAIAGIQQPVCARCTGLYVSGALGALIALMGRRRSAPPHTRELFALAAIPTAVTVVLEFSGAAFPSNLVRALSGLPLGALAGWVFVAMLNETSATAARLR